MKSLFNEFDNAFGQIPRLKAAKSFPVQFIEKQQMHTYIVFNCVILHKYLVSTKMFSFVYIILQLEP